MKNFCLQAAFGEFCLTVAVIFTLTAAAQAFNPPVDASAGVRVRIEGPAEVTQTDTPIDVRVTVENQGDRTVEGTLQLGLVEPWEATPANAVPVRVEAKQTAAREFRVTVGKTAYSALYPIHAFARLTVDGQPLALHPVLIVSAKLPKTPRPAVVLDWKPVPLADRSQLALWELPIHRTVIAVFDKEPRTTPVGWQGSDPQTAAVSTVEQVSLAGQPQSVLGIHPPWKDGHPGTALVEFPLSLPKTGKIALRFANALALGGHSDGVTFRVRVLPLDAPQGQFGKILFERNTLSKTWLAGQADLTAYAGQSIRLQLESHPGPKHNTGWDHSNWAEPTLVCGTPEEPAAFPPTDQAGSRLLGRIVRGRQSYDVRLWPGQRGLLDAAVGFACGPRTLFFHGFEVRAAGGRLDDPRSPITLVEAKEETCPSGCQMRHRFQSAMGSFDLVVRLWVEQEVLRAHFELQNGPKPQPWHVVYLEDVAAGPFSQTAPQVYAGTGNVIRRPEPFRLNFDGHQLSTSFVGLDFDNGISLVEGVDVPPDGLQVRPSEKHYTLHVPHASTWTLIPAENVWDAVRVWHDVNGLKPAGGVSKAAGRFVFDLWGGHYAESAAEIHHAFCYGLTDAMVVWHNWQRWGYDYRLPEIYPPQPGLGTLDDLQRLARACKQAGVLFALHDNYIDFYPDAEGFSYDRQIAFHASGEPIRAWLNEGRKAQSYRFRADRVEPFVQANLRQVREGLAPTAYFIDVWSSAGPYDYWTSDGRFYDRVFTRNTWGQQFAWIRQFLGGDAPQISESGHDQLIGWLDGAQTNHLRVGRPIPGKRSWCVWNLGCEDAERTPWHDAAHHDRFVLHGAGYPGRYEGGLDPATHGIYSDDYMATEVLDGHPAMVSNAFNRNVVRKYWLLHDLMRALALRRIEAVQYVGGDLHRQHVLWSGGGETWVNRGEADWTVAGATLPQYGFLARVPTAAGPVETSISRRGGLVVESAHSPEQLYVNGRRDPQEKPVDFGPLVTRGGCRLSRDGDRLVVTPLPTRSSDPLEVRIRWSTLPWQIPQPAQWEFLGEDGQVLSREPVRREGDFVVVACPAKAFCCRAGK